MSRYSTFTKYAVTGAFAMTAWAVPATTATAASCFASPKDGSCIALPTEVSWNECETVRHAAAGWYCREVAPGRFSLTPTN
ncbi:hypothetical protein ACFVMC_02125 [Nocardia sp. NPDC127579]|uniref:hypothetical protein n=1 Tax=Nocardia sp. NPDC127579 TaxID=3345402 RepID=UPI00362C10F6